MEQPQPASSYSSSLPLEDRPLPAQLRKTINLGHVNVSQRGSKVPSVPLVNIFQRKPIPNLNSDAQAGQFNMPFVNSRRGSESPVDVGKGETGLSDVKSALTTAEAKIMEDSLADAGEVFNGHPTDDPPVRGNERHITSLAAANMEDSLNMDYLRNTGMNFALPECVWTVSVVLHRVRANCINFLQVLQRTIGNFLSATVRPVRTCSARTTWPHRGSTWTPSTTVKSSWTPVRWIFSPTQAPNLVSTTRNLRGNLYIKILIRLSGRQLHPLTRLMSRERPLDQP